MSVMKESYDISKYNYKVLDYLAPYFRKLLPIGILIDILSIMSIIGEGELTSPFLYLDIASGVVLLLLFFAKNKISETRKVKIVVVLLCALGLFSFYRGGFVGNGIYLMITSVLLAIIFLSKRFSFSILGIILLDFILTYVKVLQGNFKLVNAAEAMIQNRYTWIYHYLGFSLIIVVAFVCIWAIKKFLIKNIIELEIRLDEIEENYNELQEKNQLIKRLDDYNSLTNLPNFDFFSKLVEEHMDINNSGTLILLDIAKFHKVNAFYGFDKGNKVLKSIADFLVEHIEEAAEFGYLGSNTFCVWFNHILDEKKFLEQVMDYEESINSYLDLSMELDIYCIAIPKLNDELMFKTIHQRADNAIKQLKRNDEYKHIYIGQEAYELSLEYEAEVRLVELAIEANAFDVFFQEKYNTKTNTIFGLEALARMTFNNQTMSPRIFIPIIEEISKMPEFGQQIIVRVFEYMPTIIKKYGPSTIVSINISAKQLSQTDFIDKFSNLLDQYKVNASNIELEITEDILIADIEEAAKVVKSLSDLGVKISIDDFGTGYSSLKYVYELPIDTIKIDKHFVDHIVDDNKMQAIIKAIINIAEAGNFEVIAEGIETAEQVTTLNQLGCYLIQGYYYSKPSKLILPAASISGF